MIVKGIALIAILLIAGCINYGTASDITGEITKSEVREIVPSSQNSTASTTTYGSSSYGSCGGSCGISRCGCGCGS